MPRFLKPLAIVLTMLFILALLYWTKCALGIDLIEDVKWENKFPILNSLQRRERVIETEPGGVIIDDPHDGWFPKRHWMELWTEDNGAGEARSAPREGVAGSGCLRINHRSEKWWALNRFDLVAASAGQTFSLSAKARTAGAGVRIIIDALAYDGERNHSASLGMVSIEGAETWTPATQSFTVPAGVRYLRLSIHGRGAGSVWIDDLKLVREK